MATYSSREVVTRRVEYFVPSPAAGAEVWKAWEAAESAYRVGHGLSSRAVLADDALTFTAWDDEIRISFTIEEPAQ